MEHTPEKKPPASRRRIQTSGLDVDQRWAALYQAVTKRMLDYLDRCESLEVDVNELEYFVLAPGKPLQ